MSPLYWLSVDSLAVRSRSHQVMFVGAAQSSVPPMMEVDEAHPGLGRKRLGCYCRCCGMSDAFNMANDGSEKLPGNTPRLPAQKQLTQQQFCYDMNGMHLPFDNRDRGAFDKRYRFVLGEPGAKFDRHAGQTYETTGEMGFPV